MSGTGLAKAALLIAGLSLLSKVFGFVREAVFAAFYGTSQSMDAFVVANMIPVTIGLLFESSVITAFIPVYNRYLAQDNPAEADRLANNVLTIILLITIVLGGFGYIFTPWILTLVAPGFSPENQVLAVELTRLMLPILLFSGLLGLFAAVQQAHKHFLYPALVGFPYNIVVISAIIAFTPHYGIYAAAVGAMLAVAAQVVIQWPGLVKCGFRYRPVLDLSHPGLRQIGVLLLPVIIGLTVNQANTVISRVLASTLETGSVSALNYASRVNMIFYSLFGVSIVTVVFPALSQFIALNDTESFKRHLNVCIRVITFFSIPVATVLAVFGLPLVEVFLQRGAFDIRATQATAYALSFFALGMLGMSLFDLLSRAFYAQHDTRTPVVVSIGIVAANVLLSLVLMKPLAHGGLALANSLSLLGGTVALVIVLNRKLGGIGAKELLTSLAKVLAASAIMAIIGYAIFYFGKAVWPLVSSSRGWLSRAVPLIAALAGSAGAYVVAALMLRSEEFLFGLELVERKMPSLAKWTAKLKRR